jgi:hypothetical protein
MARVENDEIYGDEIYGDYDRSHSKTARVENDEATKYTVTTIVTLKQQG